MHTTSAHDIHAVVYADLERYGYHGFGRALTAHKVRERADMPRYATAGARDHLAEAARHLVGILISLRRAALEGVPGAREMYEAALALSGGLARRHPQSVVGASLPQQRAPR